MLLMRNCYVILSLIELYLFFADFAVIKQLSLLLVRHNLLTRHISIGTVAFKHQKPARHDSQS